MAGWVLFGDRKLLSALDGQKVHQPSMASRVPQTLIAACMYVVVLFDLDFSARTAVHLPGGCPAGRAPATMRRTQILFCSCMCPAIACLCPSQPRVPSWLWAAHVLYRPPLLLRMLGQAGCSRSERGCSHSSQQTGRQLPPKQRARVVSSSASRQSQDTHQAVCTEVHCCTTRMKMMCLVGLPCSCTWLPSLTVAQQHTCCCFLADDVRGSRG